MDVQLPDTAVGGVTDQGEQMGDMRMDIAVGEQTDQM